MPCVEITDNSGNITYVSNLYKYFKANTTPSDATKQFIPVSNLQILGNDVTATLGKVLSIQQNKSSANGV